MTRNYDVFFVFGKAKKLHQRIFLGGVGEVEVSGVSKEKHRSCNLSKIPSEAKRQRETLKPETSICPEH